MDPTAELLVSPQGLSVIGPTPQRDGIVLGLFDLLSEGTPSKPRAVLGDAQLNVPQTPSKNQEGSVASLESRARGERTPLSAGKRFLLNQFVTPKKRKLSDQGTPSTVRGLATPAFLRRDNMLEAIEEDNEPAPRPAPWNRRALGRSLSSMIQAMKKDEDNRLDDEAEIMREMEMEEQGISIPKKPKPPKLLVQDSQTDMPLGPDRGIETEEESDEEPALGRDSKPRNAWKKKGLKRQTRRVISELCYSLRVAARLTILQCDQISLNRSPSQYYKHQTSLEMRWPWRKHKCLRMKQHTIPILTMTALATQVMLHIHRRRAKNPP